MEDISHKTGSYTNIRLLTIFHFQESHSRHNRPSSGQFYMATYENSY